MEVDCYSRCGRGRDEWPGECGSDAAEETTIQAPVNLKPVPRLKDDLRALLVLTTSLSPLLRLVRPTSVRTVRYGFGDTSGSGFGSTFSAEDAILYRHGIWGVDEASNSFNWRELTNLVETLELEAKEGRLQGCEIFVFTDNATAEGGFFRGTSSSQLLFNLVLRLRKLEVVERCMLHVIHVAGTRMIGQGLDGLSRGNLTEGAVMTGHSMTSYVPLSKTALEQSKDLEPWVRSWAGTDLEVLSPDDWFVKGEGISGYSLDAIGHQLPAYCSGIFLWCPPPAVAATAIEELRRAWHKREDSIHIFSCPRLMTNQLHKIVLKEADFVFEIPFGTPGVWCFEMHEPLLIAICLPFVAYSPWKVGGTPRILAMERRLRHLWKDPAGGTQGLFCAIFSSSRGGFPVCQQSWCAECYTPLVGDDKFHVEEPNDEGGFVWHKQGNELRYLVARSGDYLQCPFQCDLCIFQTLRGLEPGKQIADRELLRCI